MAAMIARVAAIRMRPAVAALTSFRRLFSVRYCIPSDGNARQGESGCSPGVGFLNQLSPLMTDEEEDVEDSVVNGVDDQEIGGPDAREVIRKEGSPDLAVGGPGFRQR